MTGADPGCRMLTTRAGPLWPGHETHQRGIIFRFSRYFPHLTIVRFEPIPTTWHRQYGGGVDSWHLQNCTFPPRGQPWSLIIIIALVQRQLSLLLTSVCNGTDTHTALPAAPASRQVETAPWPRAFVRLRHGPAAAAHSANNAGRVAEPCALFLLTIEFC